LGKHFDELSKSLASGMSRRASLRRFALGTAGALLATVRPGRGAQGQVIENRDCNDICRKAQFLEGKAFGRCVSVCVRCDGKFSIMNAGPFCIE